MTRFENPVLTHELRSRLHVKRLVPAILLRCVCLGLIFLLVLLARLGRGLLAFVLAETLLILAFTPGAVCSTLTSRAARRDLRDLALTRLSSPAIFLGKLAVADLYTCMIIMVSAIVMCAASLFSSRIHVWPLLYANVALLVLEFSAAAIGVAFSMVFRRNSSIAYILAYALILLLIGSVIVPGPIIEQVQSRGTKAAIIKIALHANPLIMTSRALGTMDLMRTKYIYDLAEPIVTRNFVYPNWYSTATIYFVISCLFLIPIGRRRRLMQQ